MRKDRISRLVWFLGLWLASVLALGIVAFAIRQVIHVGG